MSNLAKVGVLALGAYLVSDILKRVAANKQQFAPRGNTADFDRLMNGYNPLAEAIGCACGGSFDDATFVNDATGISGFGSKLKKAVKKTTKAVTKVAKAPVKAVQKVVKPAVKQLAKDAKSAAKGVVKLHMAPMKLASKAIGSATKLTSRLGSKKQSAADGGAVTYQDENGNPITEAQYNALMAANSVAPGVVYQDYEGREITLEQYQALLAQQQQEYGGAPGTIVTDHFDSGFDQTQVEEPTYGMDQVAADLFMQQEDGSQADQQWIVAQDAAAAAGFSDDTFPLTGQGAGDMFNTWGYDPSNGAFAALDQDPYGAQFLPYDLREHTMDAYAAEQSSGDSIIMPAGEPSTPYSADEFAVLYESDDSWSRGAAWTPDADGYGAYGNLNYGGQQLPGFWEGYGGFDWDWQNDGLGALVARPSAHGHKWPAHLVLQKPSSTYGFFMKPSNRPAVRPRPSISKRGGFQRGLGDLQGNIFNDPNRIRQAATGGRHRATGGTGSGRITQASIPRPMPILADRRGNIFVRNGGSMHRLGTVDDLCGIDGMGCALFGRDMGNGLAGGFSDFLKKKLAPVAKKVASRVTPSGFLYDRMKRHDPKTYKKFHRAQRTATPYVAIAAGVAATVLTAGAATPIGIAAIAGGVANIGSEAYGDIQEHRAKDAYEDAMAEQERLDEAIRSGNVIAESQNLTPGGGPAPGEIPGGDWPWQYPGDGVWADFLDLTDALVGGD